MTVTMRYFSELLHIHNRHQLHHSTEVCERVLSTNGTTCAWLTIFVTHLYGYG